MDFKRQLALIAFAVLALTLSVIALSLRSSSPPLIVYIEVQDPEHEQRRDFEIWAQR